MQNIHEHFCLFSIYIESIVFRYPDVKCYIYTGDVDATPEEILRKANDRFNVVLNRPVEFIFLNCRKLVEAKSYPFLTLLMQSIGSIFLGGEALSKLKPDIYIDTMGYAFTYPLFRFIAGSKVASYTHYPTISTDMLNLVFNRVQAHNNRGFIASSSVLSFLKLIYYYIFTFFYFLAGQSANVVMVNSTWTFGHIDALWRKGNSTKIVYPPCDTTKFKSIELIPNQEKAIKSIVSIGQFRPEKNHVLQLESFRKLLDILNDEEKENVRLVLVGGCRNEEDQMRVDELKNLSSSLNLDDKIIWKLNAPFRELLNCVRDGVIGLHTMWNEHFGICIVECMAGGLIMVANDSGGPKLDILKDYEGERTGYLASDVDSYSRAFRNILRKSDSEIQQIQERARSYVSTFSDEKFETKFLDCCECLFSSIQRE